jgi:hypothetical protein
MTPIRTSAKAIIIKVGCLLVINHRDTTGEWF